MCVYMYIGVYGYIFSISYHISNSLSFLYYVYLIVCQFLSPFIEKEMETENVPVGKYSSSLIILVMGLQLLKCLMVD